MGTAYHIFLKTRGAPDELKLQKILDGHLLQHLVFDMTDHPFRSIRLTVGAPLDFDFAKQLNHPSQLYFYVMSGNYWLFVGD